LQRARYDNHVAKTTKKKGRAALPSTNAKELIRTCLDRSRSEDERAKAIHALGELRSKAAVKPLLSVFSEKSPILKWAAATSLESIGSKKATRPLFGLVRKSSDLESRKAAVHAFWGIGDKRAAGTFIRLLRNPQESSELRAEIAEALCWIRTKRRVPALVRALQDKSAEVRMFAALSLGNCAAQQSQLDPFPWFLRAIPILEKLLQDHEAVGSFGTVADDTRYALKQIRKAFRRRKRRGMR